MTMNEVHSKLMNNQTNPEPTGRKRTLKNINSIIKNAIESIAYPVINTMGANGNYHIFKKETVFGHTTEITNDGVTVARSLLPLQNEPENIIASLVLEASQKTAFIAGDGTTRTIAMIYKLINNLITNKPFLYRLIKTNPYKIQEGIELAVNRVLEYVEKNKKEVDLDDIWKVAFTSSHGNQKVATNIQNIYKQLDRKDWGITIDFEEGVLNEDVLIKKTGYIISVKSPSVGVTIPPRIENPRLILYNGILDDFGILSQNIHIRALRDTSPVIFIVKELNHTLVELTKEMEKTYKVPMYIVKVDTYGTDEVDKQFEDICAMATAEILTGEDGDELSYRKNAILKNKSSVRKCTSDDPNPFYEIPIKSALLTAEECIFEFLTDKHVTDEYINLISEFDSQDAVLLNNHSRRINRLKSTSCTYYVGGNTATEIQTNKYLVEDALLACASAIKSGVLHGGAWFDIQCANMLSVDKPNHREVLLGYNAVIDALKYGLQIMCKSAYKDYNKIYENYSNGRHLYNFKDFKYENIETSNILDSAASLTESLKNAKQVVCNFIKLSTLTY